MATVYKIRIANRTGRSGDYGLFWAPPDIDTRAARPTEDFSTIWRKSHIENGDNLDITTTDEWYAFLGVISGPRQPGASLSPTAFTDDPVKLGKEGDKGAFLLLKMPEGGGFPSLIENILEAKSLPGTFGIQTEGKFENHGEYQYGPAKVDPSGGICPTGTTAVRSFADIVTIMFGPKMKLYVAATELKEYRLLDFDGMVKAAGVADFTDGPGLNVLNACITHNADGTYTTEYVAKALF